jgi:hypothetical protein
LGLGERTARPSLAFVVTETAWAKVNKKLLVFRVVSSAKTTSEGRKSGGGKIRGDWLVIGYPEAAWLDSTCNLLSRHLT